MRVRFGGFLSAADIFVGGNNAGSGGVGEVNIESGGNVHTNGAMKVYENGMVNLVDGELNADVLDISDSGAEFNMTGGLLDVGAIEGDFTQDGGTFAPGDSSGTTTISGDYFANSGTLEIEIAGTDHSTEYDFVDVAGETQLNGIALDISFLSNFENGIQSTDSFIILEADGGVSGEFAGQADGSTVGTSDGVGYFRVNYTATSVFLSNFGITAIPEPSSTALVSVVFIVGSCRRNRLG